MRKVFVFIVLATVTTLALIQDRQSAKRLHVLGLESIVSAQLTPAHAGAGSTAIDLNMNSERDKDVTAKVLNWLQTATIVGSAVGQSVSNGGTPSEFTIKFNSGDAIGIIDAVGTLEPTKVENGIQFYRGYVENQVTVYWKGQALRIVAPELKTWIEVGWLQEQSFTFTPDDAVAKVLKEHPEFPATGEKQIYEDIGGIQGHKQPVTLTTKVEKRGLLNYAVTLTKDFNLNVGGKEAIQSWVYSVSPSNVTLISQQGNAPNIK